MNKYEFKSKIKSVKTSTWIYLAATILLLGIGIALGIVAMYMNGFTFASWMAKYYPWVIVVAVALLVILLSVIYHNYRKKMR